LRKGVERVVVSPTGETAIIIHTQSSGNPYKAGLSLDARINRLPGYTLLHPKTGDLKLQITDVTPSQVAFVPDGSYAFMLFNADSVPHRADLDFVREVHRIESARFLVSPIIKLDSPPVSVGPVPGQSRMFVAQDHPDGRLTLVDWNTAEIETITGFELNSRIRN
jgi:hypothetical protein